MSCPVPKPTNIWFHVLFREGVQKSYIYLKIKYFILFPTCAHNTIPQFPLMFSCDSVKEAHAAALPLLQAKPLWEINKIKLHLSAKSVHIN